MSPILAYLLLISAAALVAVAFSLRRSPEPAKQRAATRAGAIAGAAATVSILLLALPLIT